eukprot:TRINITY_DN624_c0_g1_i1.p1 TRINITY_DN624_c0_g1~~TRINITY_DN624_c0_g1_i1.p1  ORF type:complete len:483 (+),score=142.75 TRINITY_DN624_c0_g1_i1:161-1609(+)
MVEFPLYTQEGASELATRPYLLMVLIFSISESLFELYLLFRRYKLHIKRPGVPKELITILEDLEESEKLKKETSEEKEEEIVEEKEGEEEEQKEEKVGLLQKTIDSVEKSHDYSLDKIKFASIKKSFDLIVGVITLVSGLQVLFWEWSVGIAEQFGWDKSNEIICCCIFISVATFISTIVEIPFNYYSTFVIEEKHGFNKQTIGLFIKDILMMTPINLIMICALSSGIVAIYHFVGDNFVWICCIFVASFSLFMMQIYPSFIAPLFNKYTPLPDGELKESIESLAKKCNFPLKKLYEMDGSKRSGHSNAYMYGFGKNKQIVLYDTIIKQTTVEETTSILGHELGHWKHSHTMAMFVYIQFYVFVTLFLFQWFTHDKALFASFGFVDTPFLIGLNLFMNSMMSPLSQVLSLIQHKMSRSFEFQADRYACDNAGGEHLQKGLVKISVENLGSLCVDWLNSMFYDSHPPLVIRLKAMSDHMKKKQ